MNIFLIAFFIHIVTLLKINENKIRILRGYTYPINARIIYTPSTSNMETRNGS